MRWLILTNFPPKMGGLQTRTLSLVEELLRRNFEVHAWCIGANLFRNLECKYKNLWVTKINVLNTRRISFSEILFYYKKFKQTKFDALFFCIPGTPEFFNFIIAAKLAKIKHIIMHVGAWPVTINNHPVDKLSLLKGIGRWWWRFYIQSWLAMQCVTLALFNNKQQLKRFEYLYSLYFSKKVLWWPPINLSKFQPNENVNISYRAKLQLNDCFVFGSVGRLCNQKRYDILIKAFHLLKKNYIFPNSSKEIKLLLVGKGELYNDLKYLSRALGLAKDVIFLGERKDVYNILNVFDAFVFSSGDFNETLGIAVLEAMACGIPCIVSDIPGPRRIVGNNEFGLLFKANDYKDLYEKMLLLYKDKALRDKFKLLGQQRAQNCCRDKVVDNLLKLLS